MSDSPTPPSDPSKENPSDKPRVTPRQNPYKAQDPLALPKRSGGTPKVELPKLPRSPGLPPSGEPTGAIDLPSKLPPASPEISKPKPIEIIRLKDQIPFHQRPEFRALVALLVVAVLATGAAWWFLKSRNSRQLAAPSPLPASPETPPASLPPLDPSASLPAAAPPSELPGAEFLARLRTAAELGNLQTFEALASQGLAESWAQNPAYLIELARICRDFLKTQEAGPAQRERMLHPILTALITAAGDDPRELERAGNFLLELGQVNEAVGLLEKASEGAPNRLSTLRDLAFALIAVGERNRAVDLLRRLVEAVPDSVEAREALATLHEETNDPAGALNTYESILRIDPSNREALDRKLFLLRVTGRNDEALAATAEILEREGDTTDVLTRRAEVLLAIERWSEARETFERALAAAPDPSQLDAAFYTNFGTAHLQLGSLIEAEKYYRKVVEIDPYGAADAKNNLAFLLLQQNRNLDKAVRFATDAIDLQPNNPDYLDTHGFALLRTGEIDRARERFLRAIERSPKPHPDMFEHLGDAEAALENWKAAADAWQRALALDPERKTLKPRIDQALAKVAAP